MIVQALTAPDDGAYPFEARLADAAALQTALVNSKLCLFKDGAVTVDDLTNKAAYVAAECDFDGYTPGGLTLAAWGDPIEDQFGASVVITGPSKQFNYVDGVPHQANDIGGAFLLNAAGDLVRAWKFPAKVTVANNTDGVIVLPSIRL